MSTVFMRVRRVLILLDLPHWQRLVKCFTHENKSIKTLPIHWATLHYASVLITWPSLESEQSTCQDSWWKSLRWNMSQIKTIKKKFANHCWMLLSCFKWFWEILLKVKVIPLNGWRSQRCACCVASYCA